MLGAALAFGLALVVHLFVLERPLIAEGRPLRDEFYLLEGLLVLLSSWMLVAGLFQNRGRRTQPSRRGTFGSSFTWGTFYLPPGGGANRARSYTTKELILWMSLFASALFLALYVGAPRRYAYFGREDAIIENTSALLAGAAALFFLLAALRCSKHRSSQTRWHGGGSLALALAAFLVAMEEISWFQRVLEIETPASFAGNLQQEMNLHNFATDPAENLYYTLGFLLLTVLPFAWHYASDAARRRLSGIAFFMPSLLLTYVSAVTAAYVFDMWNIPHIQFGFFAAGLVLFYDLPRARRDGEALYTWVVLGLLMLTQGVHLVFGTRQYVGWELTEYREWLLPAGLAVYAVELYHRARR